MKQNYENPTIEIISVNTDVIVTSGAEGVMQWWNEDLTGVGEV